MIDQNEWLRVLNLARSNAAQDLNLSNEILLIVDDLVRSAEKNELDDAKISLLSGQLVDVAVKLTHQSKKMSYAITKLVGAV